MKLIELTNKLNKLTKGYTKKEVYNFLNESYNQIQEDLRTGKASYLGIEAIDNLKQRSEPEWLITQKAYKILVKKGHIKVKESSK